MLQRRIAIKPPMRDEFEFPVEGGPKDCTSHYQHGKKYPSNGFSGQRWAVIRGVPTMFRADDHDQRFEDTFRAVEWLESTCSREERRQACYRLIAMNSGDCYLSQMFGSHGDVGVDPPDHRAEMLINTRAFDAEHPYLPARVLREGLNLRITEPDIHRGPFSKFSRAKLGINYMFSNIAKHRAKLAGLDDGTMLDESGYISENSVSNLILLEDQRLISPWEYSSPLNGITKRTTAAIAVERHGLKYVEEEIPVGRLAGIRGAIATGTAIGVVMVRRFVNPDGSLLWELQDREAEKLLGDLADDYWKILYGAEPGYHPEWFTPVPADVLALPEPLVSVRT